MKENKELLTAVLSINGTRSQIIVTFLKDVSAIPAIVSVVQTGSIPQHLQSERQGL